MKPTLTMLLTLTMPMVFSAVTCSKVAEQKITSITLTTDLAVRLSADESDLVVDNDQLFAKWEITPFNNQNLPLILIDGVEVMREDMLKLKPDDIESLSVVEDSIFTTAYGAKGANSVILVKTKLGFLGPGSYRKILQE